MPELLLELLSEEIPARMQARGAADLARLVGDALASLAPEAVRTWHGPRRIALAATLRHEVPSMSRVERGPRHDAPARAVEGFLRKHGADAASLLQEGDHYVLRLSQEAESASAKVASAMPALLRSFPWPKSMRWGASGFSWVRPLRRILCLLDGKVVPFGLATPSDAAHGLTSTDDTEGHHILAPSAFQVFSLETWESGLAARHVVVDAGERRRRVWSGLAALAAAKGLETVADDQLLDEVVGLVEWPVPLLGRIEPTYMDLPREVMQVSMRVNQRYFALRHPDGTAAPWFGFVANIEAPDGNEAVISGNERVLRARFADARHFWDTDLRTPFVERAAALGGITFHAKLGTQGARAARIAALARRIASQLGSDAAAAEQAGRLAKADLTTGMVSEFPELQGVVGQYYALHSGLGEEIANALRDQYFPQGLSSQLPSGIGIALAIADRLDTLAGFFAIGERPTGSGDPYALRRAALALIVVIRETKTHLGLESVLAEALRPFSQADDAPIMHELLAFIVERLRIQLRSEGARHDVLRAVFDTSHADDLIDLLARSDSLASFLSTQQGASLLGGYRRAANILRIEDRRDGPHVGQPDESLFAMDEERALAAEVRRIRSLEHLGAGSIEAFTRRLELFGALRPTLDGFFEHVTVNDADASLRRNRLRLLASARDMIDASADFSKIEG